jgi:hypothetical protein
MSIFCVIPSFLPGLPQFVSLSHLCICQAFAFSILPLVASIAGIDFSINLVGFQLTFISIFFFAIFEVGHPSFFSNLIKFAFFFSMLLIS